MRRLQGVAMAGDSSGGDGGGDAGSGGVSGGDGGGERTVPYDRFQRVVAERNDLKGKVSELEGQVQQHSERAATADTLASQLKEEKAGRQRDRTSFEEELGLVQLGLNKPSARAVARALYGELPEQDRPSMVDWLTQIKESPDKADPDHREALSPWLAVEAAGETKVEDKKGNASTRTGQRTDGQQRSGEPLSAEKIREIRERAQRTGNWEEWKKVREGVYEGS